ALGVHRLREVQRGGHLRVVRLAGAVVRELVLVDPDEAADRGMGREAVTTAVVLGDGDRDLLAELAGERPADGAIEVDPALEDGGVPGHRARHVWGHAEGGLDSVQQVLRLAGRGAGIEWGQTRHRRSFHRDARRRAGASAHGWLLLDPSGQRALT